MNAFIRLVLFSALIGSGAGAQGAEIVGVRAWSETSKTRIVFDMTSPVQFKVFSMREPHRIVVDFQETSARGKLNLPSSKGNNIRRLRHAKRGASSHRVVLDLNKPVSYRKFVLTPSEGFGNRIVLDLTTKTNARPKTPSKNTARVAESSPDSRAVEVKPNSRVGREVVVAIDAGHGGIDVGAIGPTKVYEKHITLAIARELASQIDNYPHMRAVLTRADDRYLKLRERMTIARGKNADLFVSIHADAFKDRRVKGSSVYVLSQKGASSEAAQWLARNENASDLIGGVSLEDKDNVLKSVLLDLSQTASIESSIDVGGVMLGSLKNLGPLHKREVQHAGFMVLKSPDIPSILIETGFISNPEEEKRLSDKRYRKRMAKAMALGIRNYFEANPPSGTAMAEVRSYRVARGDTLSEIAVRHSVTVDSIMVVNNMQNDMVRIGEIITIP